MDGPEQQNLSHDLPILLHMPVEIITHVLTTDILDFKDIVHLGLTCTRLHEICESNDVWKRLFISRWPSMQDAFNSNITDNWKIRFKLRHEYGLKIKTLVGQLSPKCYHLKSDELSKEDFLDMSNSAKEPGVSRADLVDELLNILHDGEPNHNLTEKYYVTRVLVHEQHELMKEQITDFINLPQDKQTLEQVAVFVGQWGQPSERLSLRGVQTKIEEICGQVRERVQQTHPQHPLLENGVENHEGLRESLWSCDQCRVVLEAINHVLYVGLGYCGNRRDYYNINNSFINKVLELRTGIPITLCILYASIAGRLGVVCEPISAPMHFQLRWKSKDFGTENTMYTFIDAYNKGKFLGLDDIPRVIGLPWEDIRLAEFSPVPPLEVMKRMVRNLAMIGREQRHMGDNLMCLRYALELSLLINPDDMESRTLLIRVNIHENVNLPDVIDELDKMVIGDQVQMGLLASLLEAARHQHEQNQEYRRSYKLEPKTRKKPKDAVFSVGLVMKHKRYDYNCVIYGWDSYCKASREWIVQMGVHNLPLKDKQPFYNVLVADGSERYAAQENLELNDSPCTISHEKVGKYFSSFEGTHYKVNAEVAAKYPDDVDITARLVHEKYHT